MKKLNNKGITTIEVIICFILVVTITTSMYSTVAAFNQKRNTEQYKEEIYSWWSYRFHAREKNAGWRIDYFIASDSLKDKLVDAKIHTSILGSDHCPVELDINA